MTYELNLEIISTVLHFIYLSVILSFISVFQTHLTVIFKQLKWRGLEAEQV